LLFGYASIPAKYYGQFVKQQMILIKYNLQQLLKLLHVSALRMALCKEF
jgi:hypothetical protein